MSMLTVPLFPLPGTILFPGVRLPFYVFEPRYRAMLTDVLDGAGLVGIPMLQPGFETASGSPPIMQLFGVGSVETWETQPDGTSHIEVVGRWRVRLLEELPSLAYRRANVQVLTSRSLEDAESEILRAELQATMARLRPLGVSTEAGDALDEILADARRDLEGLTNLLATVVVGNSQVRQTLLEEDDVALRCRHFITIIQTLIQELNMGQVRRRKNGGLS